MDRQVFYHAFGLIERSSTGRTNIAQVIDMKKFFTELGWVTKKFMLVLMIACCFGMRMPSMIAVEFVEHVGGK